MFRNGVWGGISISRHEKFPVHCGETPERTPEQMNFQKARCSKLFLDKEKLEAMRADRKHRIRPSKSVNEEIGKHSSDTNTGQ